MPYGSPVSKAWNGAASGQKAALPTSSREQEHSGREERWPRGMANLPAQLV